MGEGSGKGKPEPQESHGGTVMELKKTPGLLTKLLKSKEDLFAYWLVVAILVILVGCLIATGIRAFR